MSSSARVIPFPVRDATSLGSVPRDVRLREGIDETHSTETILPPADEPKIQEAAGERLTLDDLFPTREFGNKRLTNALALLDRAVEHIDHAIQLSNSDDCVGADDEFQRLGVLLPELFCCRDIGDGFGSVVNGLWSALQNLQGKAASPQQLVAFGHILRKIRNEPLLSEDTAVELLVSLEERDLTVEPPGFDILADWLSG